jgi:hypothetical protein
MSSEAPTVGLPLPSRERAGVRGELALLPIQLLQSTSTARQK